MKFDFLFLLNIMISIFDRIEILNAGLQKVSLRFQEAQHKINNVIESIQERRNSGFGNIWNDSNIKSNELGLKQPNTPRVKKTPKHFSSGAKSYTFPTIKDQYRALFYEIVDTSLFSLNKRFQKNFIGLLSSLEKYIVGKDTGTVGKDIIDFYGSDFDKNKLKLHRDMFLDIAESRKIPIDNSLDVITLLKNDKPLRDLLPELNKLVRIILMIPVSSCTAERSFSALRKLKTFLRSTMGQLRLNNNSILHIHRDEEVDISIVANQLINSTEVRQNTFSLK